MRVKFEERLTELAGVGAVNCGHFAWEGDGNALVQCAQSALSGKSAFRPSSAVLGIDSALLKGIAVNSKGEIFLVIGDSDVHGGGGRTPKPALVSFKCIEPSRPVDPGTLFDCKNRVEI